MSRLVVIVPLKAGARERVDGLLREGPPFDLEQTQFDRHHVCVTDREVVFVFESDGPRHTLHLPAEDPGVWRAAQAWRQVMAARPRIASTAYSWARPTDPEGG